MKLRTRLSALALSAILGVGVVAAGAAAETKDEQKKPKPTIAPPAEDVEDNQSKLQFQLQQGTSDLQNAENVRSQSEKRLEQQRKDLIRNWGG